jgi:hypothetical protein
MSSESKYNNNNCNGRKVEQKELSISQDKQATNINDKEYAINSEQVLYNDVSTECYLRGYN